MPRPAKSVPHVTLDKRTANDPASVRAVILARTSDPNSKDERIDSQVAACEAFVRRMGWTLVSVHSEKKSGYLHVERPALAEVEALIRQRDVHVVVCLNFERLAREATARGAALAYARRYGVEYRFAELKPDGKIPDTDEAMMLSTIMEAYGALNRKKIHENTMRGKLQRAINGKPTGGRGGAPYGLRKAREGEPYTVWMENEAEATILRELFTRIATDEHTSANSLATELNTRGDLTRAGNYWTTITVTEKIRNSLYCGRGRIYHWQTDWEPRTNVSTNETWDIPIVKERAADAEGAYLPIRPDALPVLIDPDLWDRANAMLDARSRLYGKAGRANSPHGEWDTLLDAEFVKCAHCGRGMTRHWRNDTHRTRAKPVAYYGHGGKHNDPKNPCPVNTTPAPGVDALVLRLLAFAFTDPEQVIALADANTQRYEHAAEAVEIATAKLGGYADRLAALGTERQRLTKKLQLSDPDNPDDAEDIARYRERIARLDAEGAEIQAAKALLTPAHATAEARRSFLHDLFTFRDSWINWETGETGDTGEAWLQMGERLELHQAAALLGLSEDETRAVLPFRVAGVEDVWDDEKVVGTVVHEDAAREDVIYSLLQRTAPAQLRRLLRNLGATVEISRPRPKAERAAHGTTPVAERVTLVVGPVRLRSARVTNSTPFVTWALRKEA